MTDVARIDRPNSYEKPVFIQGILSPKMEAIARIKHRCGFAVDLSADYEKS